MKRTHSIAAKIWLSFSILLIGYCVSIMLGFRLGQQTEARLRYVSDSLFIAATQSQIAQTAFSQEIRFYNDAVILEDHSLLESAREKADDVQDALEMIVDLTEVKKEQKQAVHGVLHELETFMAAAQTVYSAMAASTDLQGVEELNMKASQLARQTEEFRSKLSSFTQEFAAALKEELAGVSRATKRQRYTELISFFVVVILATVVTAVFIQRSLLTPIQKLAAVASKIAVGDLSGRILLDSRDELGTLANAFREMMTYMQNVAHIAQRLALGEIQVDVAPKSDQDVLNQAFSHTIHYIQDVADVAQKVAVGDMRVHVEPRSRQDVLNLAFANTIHYIRDVAHVAQKVAVGDIQVSVEPKSEHDLLNKAFSDTIHYIQQVADLTEKISQNNLDVTVTPQSQQDTLSMSLQRMILNLRDTQEKIERTMADVDRQNWIKTGQTELNNLMSGEQEPVTLAKDVMTYIARYVGAQVGALYLADRAEDKGPVLKLTASYAYTKRRGQHNAYRLGESLVGQAALEQERIIYSNVPDDYTCISSGLGETVPQTIVVMPFTYEGDVKGVFELGSSTPFRRRQLEFLEQVSENIAITFHTAQARITMRELLQKTQQQAEALQAQQEELRQSNEELEERSNALQESEAQLQAQQEELRQTNEDLERQAKALEEQKTTLKERNLALEQSQRLVQEKVNELELANKYKSEFLANMSHELRTPLNSLLILSNLLFENKEGNLTDKQQEFARMIHTAGTELVELIDDILDLSKIETGKMTVHVQDVKIESLTTYIEQHFTHIARKNALKLTIESGEELPLSIRTDRKRLEQIVKNFLSNAFKFTDQGSVTVRIMRPEPDTDLSKSGLSPGQSVALSVSDTGIGIPSDKQALIFEAFQQADGATTRKYGGTGLGLSISNKLASLLGGEIQVASEGGKGSTFILYLPEVLQETSQQLEETAPVETRFPQDEQKNPQEQQPFPEEEAHHPDSLSAIRDDRKNIDADDTVLLVIEHDPAFARTLLQQAHEKSFKCLLAGDGEAGLQLAFQHKPEGIILDITLPRMDGWTVMEKLQENLETRYIPVHCISAREDAQKVMNMGAIGYITKPVTLEKLHEAFNTIEHTLSNPFKKVLVVEDDETMQTSIIDLLNTEQTEIVATGSGEEAYQFLQHDSFDCLVLDLGLADISGMALLERIKQNEDVSHIPVIVYTGKALNREEEMQLSAYTESIIVKGAKSQERLLDEVMLFLHRMESELPKPQQQKLRRMYDQEAVLEGKNILIVDDDMRNVFALSNVLEEHGMEVSMAVNGKAALEQLEAEPHVDLVLMDIMMPDMDGYDAIRAIRQQSRFHKLPIIALTAKAMRGDRQKCIEAGASDYLSKPVDTDKLLSLLRVWLY